MQSHTQKQVSRKFVLAAAVMAAASSFALAQPAQAGSWTLTSSVTGGYSAGVTGSGPSVSSSANSYSYTNYGDSGGAVSGSFVYTGTIQWVPNGSLASDPAPATVTLSETGDVYGSALYVSKPATTSASDGLGDPGVTTTTTGYPGNSQSTTSSGSHTTVIAIAAGKSYTFTRHFTNYASGGGYNEALVQYQDSVK